MKEISKELGLPEPELIKRMRCEADNYGASTLVARKIGKDHPPLSAASWTHGWRFQDLQIPIQLLPPDSIHRPLHLVATKEHEEFLLHHGFSRSWAVGLAFAYVDPDPSVKRMPGSLLVMPPHIFSYTDFTWDEESYCEYIQSIASNFSRVVFCICQEAIKKNHWLDNLKKHNFDYVSGANSSDINSLARMRKLFDSFESMTTNAFGSHVLYASYCGVKVSVAGPFTEYHIDMLRGERHWGDPIFMEGAKLNYKMAERDFLINKFPFLFVEPHDASQNLAWAKQEIGDDCKIPFEQLAKRLGWQAKWQLWAYGEYGWRGVKKLTRMIMGK